MPCTPRMQGCAAKCLHRQLVEDYRCARQVWEEAEERETAMYPAERRDFKATNPPPTFKKWLQNTAARRTAEIAEATAA